MAEKEYIERGALLERLKKTQRYFDVKFDVLEAPAADVAEVVRCKDCRMFVQNKEAFVTYCRRELKNLYVKPTDFCSYGERKETNR